MKKDTVTLTLSIILFLVPVLIVPDIFGAYNVLKISILLTCSLILLFHIATHIDKLKIDKTDKLIFIFGGIAILSTIFSKSIITSLTGASNRFEGIFTIITYILIYYNSKYYFKNYKNFTTIASIIYILICVFAIIQFYVNTKIKLTPLFSKGATGTFGHSNFMGSFVSIVLPFFILGSIFKKRKLYYLGSILRF